MKVKPLKWVLIAGGLAVIAVGYGMIQCKRKTPTQLAPTLNNPLTLVGCGAGYVFQKVKDVL